MIAPEEDNQEERPLSEGALEADKTGEVEDERGRYCSHKPG